MQCIKINIFKKSTATIDPFPPAYSVYAGYNDENSGWTFTPIVWGVTYWGYLPT